MRLSKFFGTVQLTFLCLLVAAPRVMAADPVADALDKAKAARTSARNSARTALIGAFDAQIKDDGSSGDLEKLRTLTTQKDAFMTAGVVPDAPSMKDAATQYTQSMHKADVELVAAFESAIEAYTSDSKPDLAMQVRSQRRALLDGTLDKPAADSPESVAALLDQAKAAYIGLIADAKKAYLDAVDARINKASDAGDLDSVTRLQAARSAVATDSPLPVGFSDATVISARSRYTLSVQSANKKLALAYRDAVRNYTRLRAIDKAQAAQAELDATGLTHASAESTDTGAVEASGGMIKLTRSLPAFLTTSGEFSAEADGIKPSKGTVVASKLSDLMTKNFIFDVAVHIPKNGDEVNVGLGDMTRKGSLRIMIREEPGYAWKAFLGTGDGYGKDKEIGSIHANEIYVVQIERHDGPVTLSIGSITDGKFTADMSRTIEDPKAVVEGMTEKRSHIYFEGEELFTQTRFAVGNAPPANATGDAAVPSVPVKLATATAGDSGTVAVTPTPVVVPTPPPAPAVPPAPTPAVAAPVPAPAPTVVASNFKPGLAGEYFGGSGFKRSVGTRVDTSIDFHWARGEAPITGCPTPKYSVRWKGEIVVPAGGLSAIGAHADDGCKVFIDGVLVDHLKKAGESMSTTGVTAGRHAIIVEYWNDLAEGTMELRWIPAGGTQVIVPASALMHDPAIETQK